MVDPGERFCRVTVRVGASRESIRQRPRVESGGGSFFGQEDVVQVAEDGSGAFPCPILAFFDDLLAGFRFFRFVLGAARSFRSGWDGESSSTGDDFDLAERFVSGRFETIHAQPAGADRDRFEDEVLAAAAQHVTYEVMGRAVVHQGHSTAVLLTLEDIGVEIYATVDRMAMRLGDLLDHAVEISSRAEYERWVTEDLPFGLDTAKRLRAIFLAYRELPDEMLVEMPRPWQALYALAAVPRPVLEQAIEDGTVNGQMTVEQTRAVARELNGRPQPKFSQADLWAARLVSLSPADLSPEVKTMLSDWLALQPR